MSTANESMLEAAKRAVEFYRRQIATYERQEQEAYNRGDHETANNNLLLAGESRKSMLQEEAKVVQYTSLVNQEREALRNREQTEEERKAQNTARNPQPTGNAPRISANDPSLPPPPAPPATANEISGLTQYQSVPDSSSPTGYRDQLTGLPYDPNAADQVEDVVVSGTRSELLAAPSDHRIRVKPLNPEDFFGPPASESNAEEQSTEDHLLKVIKETNGVIFPYTPNITYGHQVNYSTSPVVHSNQDYFFYNNTSAVQFQISAKFTAQNEREAQYLLAAKHFFATASKMRFGEEEDKRGLPPPMLVFSGYGDLMFNNLPVIMNNFTMDLSEDQDYVEVDMLGSKSWVPALAVFQLTFTVQQTPAKTRTFNFARFASGDQLKDRGWI